jgi:outer membrane lipoprotein-sorting protein
MFERRRVLLLALALASFAVAAPAQSPSAQEILAASDRIRNPSQPFRLTSSLVEFVGGKPRAQDVLFVYAKEDPATHRFRNLVRYVEPPRDAGKMALLDNHVLWFYDPASKASVRISPQQRLIGQASVGDILTVNLAADYTGTLAGSETIQDAARQDKICWHLDMTAATDLATYNRVEYWVEQATSYPIKAKFYSDSGRLLKILYFRGFSQALGVVRPTEAVIIDAVDTALVTTLKFSDYRAQEIPEAWFQRDYLPRLKAD